MTVEEKLKEYFGEEFWPGTHWDFTPEDIMRLANCFYKFGQDELKKDAIHCNVFLHDGGLLPDCTWEQLSDAFDKIDVNDGDKIDVIVLKS